MKDWVQEMAKTCLCEAERMIKRKQNDKEETVTESDNYNFISSGHSNEITNVA